MKDKGRLEREVQAVVLGYLSFRADFFFWRANTGVAQFGKSFVKYGLPGAPDIQGVQAPSGRFVGIELKREQGGAWSPDQRRWAANCEAHGGIYILATCVHDVVAGLGPCYAHISKQVRRPKYSKGP